MRRNNKQVTTYFILFSLLLIGVVYAILQANLQINGTAKIQANTWDIHFDNIQVNENSVSIGTGDSAATIDPENNCKVDFEVTLSIPGDFYEFTIDVVNAGTIDGMIGELNKSLKVNNEVVSDIPDYLDYSVTYADGMEILENHKLAAGVTETYKVKLEFKTDIEELPEATTITTSLTPQYIQADSSSVVRPNVFVYGSWSQILDAYNSGNLTNLQAAMEAGTTREIQLDLDYDGIAETTNHVRIANLSSPSECESSGFSESSCGFILEFADIITTHRMNPYTDGRSLGDGNKGGWEYSDMRAFLNSGKYLEGETGEIDYTNSGIYNSLPQDLKNIIISTKVVTGYEPGSGSVNHITIDKLYLLSLHELFHSSDTGSDFVRYDKAYNLTRQFDCYHIGLSPTKSYHGTSYSWFLRSVQSYVYHEFQFVYARYGTISSTNAASLYGVSPAFRIAE